MEKNVSGVDLEELLKAREELDRERGVETDPNLYRDYNPNRESESEEKKEVTLENENNYETITNIQNPAENENNQENILDSSDENATAQESNVKEESIDETQSSVENLGNSESNLSKFDIFSAFEVKENVPSSAENGETSSSPIQSRDKSEIILENAMSEGDIDSKLEKIDNADELEDLLSQLLDELDEDDDEINAEPKVAAPKADNNELNLFEALSVEKEDKDEDKIKDYTVGEPKVETALTSIDIEPKFDNKVSVVEEEIENEEKVSVNENLSENTNIVKKDSNPLDDLELAELLEPLSEEELMTDEEIERELNEIIAELEKEAKKESGGLEASATMNGGSDSSEVERVIEDLSSLLSETASQLDDMEEDDEQEVRSQKDPQEETKVELDNSVNNKEIAEPKIDDLLFEVDDTEESDDENNEPDEVKEDSEEEINDEEESEDDQEELVEETPQVESTEEKIPEEPDINSIFRMNREPEPVITPSRPQPQPVYAENTRSTDDVEVITDYSQLRDILQKQLNETEEIETDEFKKKYTFKEIADFKFIDEIASDDFKEADKFSYILGKNENGEMVYGNFREHCNLAVFGRNDNAVNSMLNSMILSLCLKNSFNDVNFVLLDSDINSPFEVYNKSSYLYFNRIAKTNKEILDTLIEVAKEVDNRYNKLAGLGVKNIEAYNETASENNMQTMPTVILVFNNYTSASQATDHDRINACLYQILKYGRIAGIYAVVTAKLPIEVNQINYSLSSRISLKSDEASRFTVGVEGVEYLPSESDAMYYNIVSNKTEHLKIATVTDMELDLIIKDLEE